MKPYTPADQRADSAFLAGFALGRDVTRAQMEALAAEWDTEGLCDRAAGLRAALEEDA